MIVRGILLPKSNLAPNRVVGVYQNVPSKITPQLVQMFLFPCGE